MMEQRGKAMLEVPCGQDPYNAIGDYIEDHITAIEDIIATIEVDGIKTNQLLMVDMKPDHYFVWDNDWWEGEENVALIDFFPVSEAQKPSVEREKGKWIKDNGLYKCSACNDLCTVAGWADCIPEEQMYKTFKFCPNCGNPKQI